MADFNLSSLYEASTRTFEERIRQRLPSAKRDNISNPDEPLLAFGAKFSRLVSFENTEITMEWTPSVNPDWSSEALADYLCEG